MEDKRKTLRGWLDGFAEHVTYEYEAGREPDIAGAIADLVSVVSGTYDELEELRRIASRWAGKFDSGVAADAEKIRKLANVIEVRWAVLRR